MTAELHSKKLGLTVWIVWANWTKFNNTGPKDGDSDIDPIYYGAGVHTMTIGGQEVEFFNNGVLMQCTISPVAFVAFTNVQYEIQRTSEAQMWRKDDGVWSKQGDHFGPEPDGPTSTTKDITPSSSAHIYSDDIPGFLLGPGGPDFDELLRRQNSVECAYIQLGNWTAFSDNYEWHSISWVEWREGAYHRKSEGNEIETGAITVGTGSTPP